MLAQDDHVRKRRTTEERCCQGVRGWRIPLSLRSAEVLSGQITCTKTLDLTGPTRPPTVLNEIFFKTKAAGEVVPK